MIKKYLDTISLEIFFWAEGMRDANKKRKRALDRVMGNLSDKHSEKIIRKFIQKGPSGLTDAEHNYIKGIELPEGVKLQNISTRPTGVPKGIFPMIFVISLIDGGLVFLGALFVILFSLGIRGAYLEKTREIERDKEDMDTQDFH